MFVLLWLCALLNTFCGIILYVKSSITPIQVQMQFLHACECVLVFLPHPTSCPGLRLSSSTTWWRKRRRRKRTRRGVKASVSLSLHYPAPWDTLCVIKSHGHLRGTAALMLPGSANQFAFPSSKRKTATPVDRMHSTANYVSVIYALMQMCEARDTPKH